MKRVLDNFVVGVYTISPSHPPALSLSPSLSAPLLRSRVALSVARRVMSSFSSVVGGAISPTTPLYAWLMFADIHVTRSCMADRRVCSTDFSEHHSVEGMYARSALARAVSSPYRVVVKPLLRLPLSWDVLRSLCRGIPPSKLSPASLLRMPAPWPDA